MRIHVMGSGAIGGLAGAYLTRAGQDVTLVDRWAEHVVAMQRHGLFIDGCRGELRVPVRAITPAELGGPLALVLLACKSQHTEGAVRDLLPHLTADSIVVSLQNGFNELLLQELLGPERVIGAIPNYGGALVEPGHLEFVHEGAIQLGELDGQLTDRLRHVASLLEVLTTVEVTTNIWGQIWSKECYSSMVVCSALVDAPIAEVMAPDEHRRIAGALVREALTVAYAAGVQPEPFGFFDPALYFPRTPAETRRIVDDIGRALAKLGNRPQNQHRYVKTGSGIWWDIVYRKRQSEVESTSGKLLSIAAQLGVPTPLNSRLCQMIYEIEKGKRELGYHNFRELGDFIRQQGAALPWEEG